MRAVDADESGQPQTMMLYATHDAWRYAIYTDRLSLEGTLSKWVTPDLARLEAARIADQVFDRPLLLHWDVLDPGWWVASIEEQPAS